MTLLARARTMKTFRCGGFVLVALGAAVTACTNDATILDFSAPDASSSGGAGTGGSAGEPEASSGCRRDADCEAPLRCNLVNGSCVECLLDEHCASHLCDDAAHVCKGCTRQSDCRGQTPHCDDDDRRCVQCTSVNQCATGEVCEAAAHACAARCRSDADCAGTNRPTCAISAGVCVECSSDAACASPLPFCELRSGSCVECLVSTDCANLHCSLEHQCHSCESVKDCDTGQRCDDGDCRY